MSISKDNTLLKLLDLAITSDNPTVKQQLESLLVTVKLVHNGETPRGVLADLMLNKVWQDNINELHYSSGRTLSIKQEWSGQVYDFNV